MKQPIAGVAPPHMGEVTIMSVWPTLGATAGGRWWGQRYLNSSGFKVFGVPVTVGRLVALASIPLILPVYFLMLLPLQNLFRLPRIGPFPGIRIPNRICRRYRLTNRRVLIEHGISHTLFSSVSLDDFDAIDVQVLPGQAWYPCGELLFRKGTLETFRLSGVSRPETFRQTCLKTQKAHASVKRQMAIEKPAPALV